MIKRLKQKHIMLTPTERRRLKLPNYYFSDRQRQPDERVDEFEIGNADFQKLMKTGATSLEVLGNYIQIP